MAEVWRSAVGWEGLYEVSDCGRIRSVPRMICSYGGRRWIIPAAVLKAAPTHGGYLVVGFSGNGRRQTWAVHRLVALAFLWPRPEGMTINHKDGNKNNNAAVNLEYCTIGENNRHALRTGLRVNPRGSRNGSAKLTEEDVATIKRRLRNGESQRAIARDVNVCFQLVWQIKKGMIWRHVS